MAIPKNKEELLHDIEITFSKLKKDLERVPLHLATLKGMEGHAKGTKMSPCNLVAYLVGWGELVLKWYDKSRRGEEIIFPDENFKWNELGKLAQQFYLNYKEYDYPTLLQLLEKTIQKIIAIIENLDDKELYKIPFYKKYPLGRMIQLNTSSPYKNARSRIRKSRMLDEKPKD